jgi:hypothetical protein
MTVISALNVIDQMPFGRYLDSRLIVGIQYYEGRANLGEAITLVREPKNDHDPNAIRCDNGKEIVVILMVQRVRQSVMLFCRIFPKKALTRLTLIVTSSSLIDFPCLQCAAKKWVTLSTR